MLQKFNCLVTTHTEHQILYYYYYCLCYWGINRTIHISCTTTYTGNSLLCYWDNFVTKVFYNVMGLMQLKRKKKHNRLSCIIYDTQMSVIMQMLLYEFDKNKCT